MRHTLLAAAILAAGACSNQSTPPPAAHARVVTPAPAPKASIARAVRGQLPSVRIGGIASLPDHGTLVAYPKATPIHDTAYTWRPVSISENHAIAAIAKGELELTAPDGSPIRLRYSRHVEHADGNWTWIGSPAGATPGNEAIITFGPTAVFGTIPTKSGDTLRLTTIRGRTWMLQTDSAMEARMGMTGADPSGRSDVRVPPRMAGARTDAADMEMIRQARTTSAASGPKATANATTANSPASSTVDLLVGYTPQFASRFGGTAGANTRITFLVDVTNQAYAASQIDAAVRLAGTLQVDYTENNSNSDALYALTGVACTEQSNGSLDCNDAPVPASLAPLVAMRATVGADVVSLFRNFNSSAQQGCGIAWLLGAGQTAIVPSDSDYGYSVVSDSNGDFGGSFPSGGFVCRDEAVAHELGHLMGAQHDRETAADTDGVLQADEYGRFPYSFGYRSGSANIYTVMAYGASGQHKVRVFSNPNIACTWSASVPAAPCGIADQADNARALRQTIPVVAAFRATVNGSDLHLIPKMGASGTTEVHVLTQASNYSAFALHQATALHTTGTDFAWRYLLGDYNRDGILDLYTIAKTGASGTTEVHVLNGATRFTTFLVHTPSVLHQTGTDNGWVFRLGDYNHDGVLDLWAITRNGATGTEIHILNGANNFATFLVHTTTPVQTSGTDGSWHFLLGDYNRDGALDVYMVVKANTGSNTTEVHVLNGANFNGFLLNTATVLHTTGTDNAWDFELSDYNADGTPDIVVIAKNGLSNTTEFHVLDGATRFATYGAHIATALQQTGSNDAFEYEVGVYR